ncbi:MAG: hypothetical protein IPM85_18120 [Chitinophagaceae bacterium]|nr:hypothetical protein [Chitinophagaceae bacterium]
MRIKSVLLPAVLLISLFACSQTGSKAKKTTTKKTTTVQVPTGRLYLRSIMYIATGKVDLGWYYLGDDGTLVKNPKNGVQPVNVKAEKLNNNSNTGTYKIVGNRIEIKWTTGDVSVMPLKFKDGDISEMDLMGIMIRQKGLPKGFVLSGACKGFNNGGAYIFEKDGIFIRSLYEDGQQVEKQGTFLVKGNNLILTFTDGTKEHCLIALLDEDLIINNSYYTVQ